MTSPNVDQDLNAGESGFYSWHNSVAKHHNDEDASAPHHAGKNISVSPSGLTVVTTSDVQAALGEIDSTLATHASRHEPGGADAMAVDAAAGTGSLRTLGSGAQQAMAGDATPNSHGDGAHSEDYARGDGALSVGQLAKIKTVSPLTLEGISSGTFQEAKKANVLTDGGRLLAWHDFSTAADANLDGLATDDGGFTWTASTTDSQPVQITSGKLQLARTGSSFNAHAYVDLGVPNAHIRAFMVKGHSSGARSAGPLLWRVDSDNYFVAMAHASNDQRGMLDLEIYRIKAGTDSTVASLNTHVDRAAGWGMIDAWAMYASSVPEARIVMGLRGVPLLSYDLTSDDITNIADLSTNFGLSTPQDTPGGSMWTTWAAIDTSRA